MATIIATEPASMRLRNGSVILTDRLCEKRVAKRLKFYDRKCPGLYVSIIPAGVATFFFGDAVAGTGSSLGQRFAEMVQEEICMRTDLTDCRTHAKTWDLLRMTRMPAVRIECGYLSSPRDSARLSDPAFRDALAEGISAAVVRFFAPVHADA